MIDYKRRKKVNPNDKDNKVSFTDELGDTWEEYRVFHHKFIDWLEINNYNISDVKAMSDEELQKIVEKSPYYKATANDIVWTQKIKMIGLMQKFICHSISNTCNIPENTSVETVSKIYEEAWRSGCKGVTIYREGSRSGVLVSNNTKKEDEEFKVHNSPKRPKELEADYYVTSAKGKKFAVIVGLYKGHPYEIFAFENPSLLDFCKGKIVKVKRGHYDFICNGETRVSNIQLANELIEERAHTIFMSMLLRHGVEIQHIINVSKKVNDNIVSFSSAVCRVLSKYVETQTSDEKCPECGEKLQKQEGCAKCICGFSKCG
jgi:ribonucleoside-diphosphate reductase alpha chain